MDYNSEECSSGSVICLYFKSSELHLYMTAHVQQSPGDLLGQEH